MESHQVGFGKISPVPCSGVVRFNPSSSLTARSSSPNLSGHFPILRYPRCFAFFPVLSFLQMFGRFSQLARHLSYPLPNYAHRSAASISGTMTSQSTDLGKRMIRTAGCLIIGDEVLGGKVHFNMSRIAARTLEPDTEVHSICRQPIPIPLIWRNGASTSV